MTGLLNRRLYLRRLSSRWGKGNRMEFGNMLWQDSSASLRLKGPLLWGSPVLGSPSRATFPHKTRSPQGQDSILPEPHSLLRLCSSRHWDPAMLKLVSSSSSLSFVCFIMEGSFGWLVLSICGNQASPASSDLAEKFLCYKWECTEFWSSSHCPLIGPLWFPVSPCWQFLAFPILKPIIHLLLLSHSSSWQGIPYRSYSCCWFISTCSYFQVPGEILSFNCHPLM